MKKSSILKAAGLIGTLSLGVLFTGVAMAVGLGDVGNNMSSAAQGVGGAVMQWGILLGLIFVIVGIVIFATHKKSNTPISYAITAIVAGIFLVGITGFINMGSETFNGSSESELSSLLN